MFLTVWLVLTPRVRRTAGLRMGFCCRKFRTGNANFPTTAVSGAKRREKSLAHRHAWADAIGTPSALHVMWRGSGKFRVRWR